MKTRILTAIGILSVIIPCLIFGGIFSELLISLIVSIGTYEYVKLSLVKNNKLLTILLIILELIGLYLPKELVLPYIGIITMILLSLPIFSQTVKSSDIFLYISFATFLIIVGNAFREIYNTNSIYIWLIILATYACDTFAYFTGRFLGKHKLNERISPKKTIEGSIGGWFFGLLLTLGFWKLFMVREQFVLALLSGIFLPIFGQLGDLAFSAIKRHFNIKDYGNLLPGHGGVLDRVDSLLFNLICFYFIFAFTNI